MSRNTRLNQHLSADRANKAWEEKERRDTGCTKGFFEAEKYVKNGIRATNSIRIFCALKSVMKVKLFLMCISLFLEKFNFHYTFQSTKYPNRICSFYTIFNIIFCFKEPFCAPCDMREQMANEGLCLKGSVVEVGMSILNLELLNCSPGRGDIGNMITLTFQHPRVENTHHMILAIKDE